MTPIHKTRISLSAIFASFCLAAALYMSSAQVLADGINEHIPNAQMVGKARLKVMLWKVFDAELYTSSGQYDETRPFALKLRYLRKLNGRKIVEQTIGELKDQNEASFTQLSQWERELEQIIPNVSRGTSITGVRSTDESTVFYKNNTRIGSISNPQFTRMFFNIWLGEKTSKPLLRKRLIGLGRNI